MEPSTTIQLDERTRAIVEAKKEELIKQTGGASTSGAIRAIILEWDWIKSMTEPKKSDGKKVSA